MIKGMRLASIWSEDLNNLLPFYRDIVGLPVGLDTPGFVVLGESHEPALALGTHSEVHGPAAEPARHTVAFETDDIDAEFARLKEQGVEFIEEPTAPGDTGVRVATFKDPEGNLIQLLQFTVPM